MIKRSSLVALLAVGTASLTSCAGSGQPVPLPYVEPGDCWSYRAEGINRRGPIKSYKVCVTFVDWQRNVILTLVTDAKDGREIEESYSTDWGPSTLVTGVIFTPPARFVRFPLRVGDTFSSEYEYRAAFRGPNAGKAKWNTTVVGWEDVTVPAGTFRALKIEGHGEFERFDRNLRFSGDFTAWYVPEVMRHVKYVYRDLRIRQGEELVEFQLNK